MIKCPHCGKLLKDDAIQCGKCMQILDAYVFPIKQEKK